MTDKQKESQTPPFDATSCMAMIEKMMGQQGCGCDCTEMVSRMMGQAGQGGCAEMMSQMMAVWCGVQDETEETTAQELISS